MHSWGELATVIWLVIWLVTDFGWEENGDMIYYITESKATYTSFSLLVTLFLCMQYIYNMTHYWQFSFLLFIYIFLPWYIRGCASWLVSHIKENTCSSRTANMCIGLQTYFGQHNDNILASDHNNKNRHHPDISLLLRLNCANLLPIIIASW